MRRDARRLAGIGVGLLLLQAFAIVADASARWLMNAPIHGLEDINGLVIPVTVASFIPALFAERGNITVTLVGRALGPRGSARLDVFGHLMALAFILLLAWQYAEHAADLALRRTVILELPLQASAWAAAGLLALAALIEIGVLKAALAKTLAGQAISRVRR